MTDTPETPPPFDFYRDILARLGWSETRVDGRSVWSKPIADEHGDDGSSIVGINDDGTVQLPDDLGPLTAAELRAFAAVADSERKDPSTGEPSKRKLFTLTDEQQALAENLAQRFTAAGIDCNADEAQMLTNIVNMGRETVDRSEADAEKTGAPFKLRTKKTTELLAGDTKISQVCLAVIAKLAVRQHSLGYDNDANLRALDIIDTMLHVVAALAPDKRKKMKHLHG